MQTQKQLIGLIVVAASLTSFLAGYLLTHKDASDVTAQQRAALIDRFDGTISEATPTPLPPGILKASAGESLSATSNAASNEVLYYHPSNGSVSRLDLETRRDTLISTAELKNLARVIWSPDKNRVVTVSRGNGLRYGYFDYTTREHGTLSSLTSDAVFAPNSDRLALVQSNEGGSTIVVTDFNGKNPRVLLKTRLSNIKLWWPTAETLAFTATDAEGGDNTYLLAANGDLTQILSGLNALSVRFSPDGKSLLYVSREQGAFTARIMDIATLASMPLSITLSRAEECAWTLNSMTLYCARQDQAETVIHRVDPKHNTDTIVLSGLSIQPQDTFMSHLENFLVIINAADQSVWAAKLPL